MNFEYAIFNEKDGRLYKKHNSLEYLIGHLQDMSDDGEVTDKYKIYKRPVSEWEEL